MPTGLELKQMTMGQDGLESKYISYNKSIWAFQMLVLPQHGQVIGLVELRANP